MLEYAGYILAFIGFALGVAGSWYVTHDSNQERRKGFFIWMCGNPINALVLIGVILNMWNGLPLIFMLVSSTYYWFTAYRGWRNNEDR